MIGSLFRPAATIAWLAGVASAAPPALEHFFPPGAQKGTTASITAIGTFPTWPTQVWCDTAHLHFAPAKQSGHFSVQIDKDAPAGPHLVRLHTPDGASLPRLFIISDHSEIAEIEPNDELSKAQPVPSLPMTINGQLDKSGDVDSFSIKLVAGQTLVASVQGRRLGSAIDPMLHLLDLSGVQQAFSQDDLGLDPLLVFTAKSDGTYVLRISAFAYPPAADIHLAGDKNAIYRLSLTTGPFIRYAMPASVERGQHTSVHLHGWNIPKPLDLAVDATSMASWEDQIFVPISGPESPLRVALVDSPPQNLTATTQPVQLPHLPVSFTGQIPAPRRDVRLRFSAARGEHWVVAASSMALACAFDPVIRIEDAHGKTNAQDDDGAGRPNASLEWAVPADGVYTLVLSDRYRQGGDGYVYHLEIRRPRPEITATVDAAEYHGSPGQTIPVHLKLTRREGFSLPLIAVAASLPSGLTSTAAQVSASAAEATINITAAPNAAPASAPFQVLLLSPDPQHPLSRPATFPLNGDTGQELLPQTQDLWLTVQKTIPPKK